MRWTRSVKRTSFIPQIETFTLRQNSKTPRNTIGQLFIEHSADKKTTPPLYWFFAPYGAYVDFNKRISVTQVCVGHLYLNRALLEALLSHVKISIKTQCSRGVYQYTITKWSKTYEYVSRERNIMYHSYGIDRASASIVFFFLKYCLFCVVY